VVFLSDSRLMLG